MFRKIINGRKSLNVENFSISSNVATLERPRNSELDHYGHFTDSVIQSAEFKLELIKVYLDSSY